MAPPVGLLLGHSFVHSLHSHLTPTTSTRNPSGFTIAKRLRIHEIVDEFHMQGERGSRICSSSFTLPHRLLQRLRPDFVILDFGTNDLASGTPPFEVAAKLVHLADRLRSQYHVDSVVICSVINRERHIRHLSPSQFAAAAYQVNNYLKNFVEAEPRTQYHSHKGFWTTPITQWSRDGIHPNSQHGRKLYIRSIRKAVFLALQSFTMS